MDKRRVQSKKIDVPAPEVVVNYNKYMGGVDKHDKLRNTFALGKRHNFKKYYVKLLLFLVDIALTNSWIYYKLANNEEAKCNESRANFFVKVATEMVRQDINWEEKYKVSPLTRKQRRARRNNATDSDTEAGILPAGRVIGDDANEIEAFADLITHAECIPLSFKGIPFDIPRKSRKCQVCNYEMRRDKWKGVVLCSKHGVRLCTESHPPRKVSSPKLLKDDGEEVSDFSWTCEETGSCRTKFHNFYDREGLFVKRDVNLNERKLCFAGVKYTSQIHQKKYAALGVEVQQKQGRTSGMGRINKLKVMGYNV
jgi:hypothetical protein